MNCNSYIIWGTGWEAERFYYQYHNKIDVLYFVDNFAYNRKFYGLEVKKPDLHILQKGKVLITTLQYFDEIKKQLAEMGFIEYKDFDYCYNVDKKIVFLNGNCHFDILKAYLSTSKKFSEEFVIGNWPLIFKNEKYDERILPYCDLFIHQDIRNNNSIEYKYSDEYILPKLRNDCIRCCIPNLYGFPKALYYTNRKENKRKHNNGPLGNAFIYCEEIIDRCVEHKESLNDILKSLMSEFVDERDICIQWEDDRKSLLEREKSWDIKISDYIFENFQVEQLFYDIGHPTNFLFKEIATRILYYLKIDDNVMEVSGGLNCYEVPVYPCIKKALKLEWDVSSLRKKMKGIQRFVLDDKEMNLTEYIREYVWWNYGIDII